MKLPKINWKLLTLAVVFGLIFSAVAVVYVFPATTQKVKEKVQTWITTHVIDNEQIQKVIDMLKNNTETDVVVDNRTTGLINPTIEELIDSEVLDDNLGAVEIPSSVDLSTSPYFPKVGDQGSEGSCAAWAVTYYAYGYMEAVQYGWTEASIGNTSQLLSPLFTYDKTTQTYTKNGKIVSMGSGLSGNGNVLQDWGACTLASYPYILKADGSHLLDFGSEYAMREALLHKSYSNGYVMKGDTQIDNIKVLLNSGTPVTIGMNALRYTAGFADKNKIISSIEYNTTTANHAQCIVGYDDSITDDGEVGAFKIVNSWGSSFGDNGYYWMTYDTMRMICKTYTPFYVIDNKVHNPTLVANLEFSTTPTRDSTITFNLLNNDTNVKVGSSVRVSANPPLNYSNFLPFPKYPMNLIYDISRLYTFGTGSNNKIQCVISDGYSNGTDGVVKSFSVENYKPNYIINSPFAVGYSSDVPRSTPTTIYAVVTPGSNPPIIKDTTPPVTTMIISGTMGPMGWYTSKVNVTFSASDSSGVSATKYKLYDSSGWVNYAGIINMPEGITTIQYYSTDSVGNIGNIQSSTVKVDSNAPVANISVGVSYTIMLDGSDSISGVASTFYNVDNGTYVKYTIPIVLIGTHSINYYVIDNAGTQSTIKTIYVG